MGKSFGPKMVRFASNSNRIRIFQDIFIEGSAIGVSADCDYSVDEADKPFAGAMEIDVSSDVESGFMI